MFVLAYVQHSPSWLVFVPKEKRLTMAFYINCKLNLSRGLIVTFFSTNIEVLGEKPREEEADMYLVNANSSNSYTFLKLQRLNLTNPVIFRDVPRSISHVNR